MPNQVLQYGKEALPLVLPAEARYDWIEPPYVPPAPDPDQVVRSALANPLDGRGLAGILNNQTAVIAINDKTRPVPHEQLLPPLLEALQDAGVPKNGIRFLIASGTHIPMPSEEYARILPSDIYTQYEVAAHNCDDADSLFYCGETTRGTPVWANRLYMEAGVKILVGNIEPHHFAGFSGGYKTCAIGLTGRQTINANHAMLVEPGSKIAEVTHNPLRQDIEEIGSLIGGEVYALNVVLNGEKKIVQAVFGHPTAVMRAGVPLSRQICQIPATGKYDLVIASVGGAPKDINFYQSQKALTHATLFTRDGGVIILAAACPEGSGSAAYEEFMRGVTTTDEVFEKFRRTGFRVGPHKAFQVARDAARVKIILLSNIPAKTVSDLLMTPAATLPEALQAAFTYLSPALPQDLRIAVLPRATNTVPIN